MKHRRNALLAGIVLALVALCLGRAADSKFQYLALRAHQAQASFLLSGASASVDPNAGLNADLGPLELVSQVLKIIKSHYVEPVDPYDNTKMAEGAVKYMVSSLGDPSSRFLDKKQSDLLADAAIGRFRGVGAVLKIREKKGADWTDQELTVVAPLAGSPAQKAGLLPGDIIDEVGGKWVMSHDPFSEAALVAKDHSSTRNQRKKAYDDAKSRRENSLTLDEATERLMSATGDPIKIKVRRGKEIVDLAVDPREMRVDPVEQRMLGEGVGYLRLSLLTPDSHQAFGKALDSLVKDGSKSLILDLRNCPDGSLAAAQSISGMLLGPKRLALVMRARGPREAVFSKGPARAGLLRTVVLINEGTEGVAEVLAGALNDSGSKMIGQTTWGNAYERTAFVLGNGSGYTLTTGKFVTPAGTDFGGKGLKPTAIVPMSPALIGTERDNQLERALLVAKRPAA